MKRIIVILLAAVMLFALSACGNKETADDPLKRDDGTTSSTQEKNNNPGTSEDNIDEVDFNAILSGNGATDFVYANMTPAQKQALIDEAKKDGVDVSFGSDGSMTVKDTDGITVIQNPDGTWTVKSEGGEIQFGGNWPENEFTKLIPKPDFEISAVNTGDGTLSVSFVDASIGQIKSYAENVKKSGFDKNVSVEDQEIAGMVVYYFNAENAAGYSIQIFSTGGMSGFMMQK